MPQYTIGLLGTQIVHVQSDEVVHPSNFGPSADDLLVEWKTYMENVGAGGGIRSRDRFFTLESGKTRSVKREFECEIDYGQYGSDRRVRDASTGSQTGRIASTEVASDGLRIIDRVPRNGLASSWLGLELMND